ncbi:hypothetical protein EDD22DRAFT_950537 [Suillus occidentalis]|nr:hypothetical protein EDD22DRAFT_950537 [Suillus occidentalis]
MNIRKIILRTVSVVLSSFGILMSLLAIFIRALIPSVIVSQRAWFKPPPDTIDHSRRTITRRVKRPGPVVSESLASSSLQSTKSSNMVDGAVPQSHAPASPMPATELHLERSNRGEVSKAHKVFKRHTHSVSSSFNACRTLASPKLRLKGRNSTGSISFPLKNPDPPLRTQPYTAPYFFPAPGTPEAIDYVMKTREELLRPSGFMHTHVFTLKRNKKVDVR